MLPKPRSFAARTTRAVPALVLFALAIAAAALLSGCSGKKDDQPALLATVGADEIRADYYEGRLAKLAENELPKGDDGQPLDMAGPEGKSRFLTTLINKSVMEQKGGQLGYANDPRIVEARKSLLAYQAGLAMYSAVVGDPANELSNEEVDALYALMGQQRKISYLLCDFRSDAEAARKEALGGADWEDVVKRYHAGEVPADGKMTQNIPFGRFDPSFENDIFATPVGEIGPVIDTDFGYWVFRVDGVKEIQKPTKEEALANILDMTRSRKIIKLRKAFEAEVHAKYKLDIREDALLKAYQGMPAKEMVIDPTTDQPVSQTELSPLAIAPADLDLPFYSYELDGLTKSFTLGDYKIKFDRMNTFQRPKKEQFLGGLRVHLVAELDRALLDAEAKARGFYENPEVLDLVNAKVNEMIATAMYGDLVVVDERVTPEELEAYWNEHHAEFDRHELRSGYLLIAADEAKALEARDLADVGTPWTEIIARYETDDANRRSGGRLDVSFRNTGPVRDAIFALEPGQLGRPFALGDGRYGLMRLETVTPPVPSTMTESATVIGQRIKSQRKEDLFNSLLAQWSDEIGVVRFEENLDKVKSWKELTYVEAPGPAVPRN